MSMNFSYQNIIDGNGYEITFIGMLIVFLGLAFTSAFIALLPRLLGVKTSTREKKPDSKTAGSNKVPAAVSLPDDELQAAAIAIALHLELEGGPVTDNQKITIDRSQRANNWSSAGIMQSLATRR
ncbi:MAG: OadG family protein [bacterium]|nr:OadG family protein [bacterium]